MSMLAEIEQAADALTLEQKLILLCEAWLRADGAQMPEPRKFTREEMAGGVAAHKADMGESRRAK